ncbi:hypothetical protein J2S18_001158 [Eubacterium multiforme]|uniref:Uncharacterized protein n=1 Tax=Eubacterium multiforme TaxID=83339 RepID=A0ABT9USD9_9FIRM|nr:hypothetical protein [Eubacterium multiforme]
MNKDIIEKFAYTKEEIVKFCEKLELKKERR